MIVRTITPTIVADVGQEAVVNDRTADHGLAQDHIHVLDQGHDRELQNLDDHVRRHLRQKKPKGLRMKVIAVEVEAEALHLKNVNKYVSEQAISFVADHIVRVPRVSQQRTCFRIKTARMKI